MDSSDEEPQRVRTRTPTYIPGLDHILGGGLPSGRTTLVAGGPGCGKTVLAMDFLARGAARGEPGVFVSFEQTEEQLREDFSNFRVDIPGLVDSGDLVIRHVAIDPVPATEAGEYGLDPLLLRLGQALDVAGARRIALDTLEVLFGHLRDTPNLRNEIRRIFRWLADRGVTALVTAEAGRDAFTRHGLEEYVSDCVILLDHRVTEEISTRRARILKYRGAEHSDDEHPFLIDPSGFLLIPITASRLDHDAPTEQISTGLPSLDALLEGGGYYRASSVLVSGTAGTGKTSVAASFVKAACDRGERALYLAFEESEAQLRRNMASVGVDLATALDEGLLRLRARRPSQHGLEEHLAEVEWLLNEFEPRVVVVDPSTNLVTAGTPATARGMLTRLVDMLKARGVTALYTSLGEVDESLREMRSTVSSVMDVWLVLSSVYQDGERRRSINVLKARGLSHSHGLHELLMTEDGLRVGETLREASSAAVIR